MLTRLIVVIIFAIYTNTESSCSLPESNITLPVNYTSIKKKIKGKTIRKLEK